MNQYIVGDLSLYYVLGDDGLFPIGYKCRACGQKSTGEFRVHPDGYHIYCKQPCAKCGQTKLGIGLINDYAHWDCMDKDEAKEQYRLQEIKKEGPGFLMTPIAIPSRSRVFCTSLLYAYSAPLAGLGGV